MPPIDTDFLKEQATNILTGLRKSGVLTVEELKDCGIAAYGAVSAQSPREVENYTRSLATMKAVALLRATRASEKAAIDLGWVALDILFKAVIVAL